VSVKAATLFTFDELVSATRGKVASGTGRQPQVLSVATDSRKVDAGCLFVALPGERTDGHAFLSAAADAGAVALLVSDAWIASRAEERERLGGRVAVVAVPDTLAALQGLARFHMARVRSVTRIGITGSNGKTTTKEIVGSILSRTAPTVINEGNLNSEIGLPLACFRIERGHRYAVLEMGMNHAGEMDVLAELARPDIALVTNIGVAHIGLLGSQQAIAAEKKKIFTWFDGRQAGLLPEDDPFRDFLAEGVKGKMSFFGPKSTPGYGGSESKGLGGTIIHWEGSPIRFPLFGPHNLANALGAISVARELGVPNAEIRDGLEAVTPLFGRSQIVTGPITLLVDCYNANPDSMESAITFLETLPWDGRKIAVLGAMRELGDQTAAAHAALGARLAATPLDAVFLLGEEMEQALAAIEGAPARQRFSLFHDLGLLGARLESSVRPGDIVLLKGSRSLEMERLLPRFPLGSVQRPDVGGARC
jgi:UDP-N-acetylmuramoyl-tripeptide--D-alanyl-D-alanine ligase